jgi:predicted PurR-regulated permease PerM
MLPERAKQIEQGASLSIIPLLIIGSIVIVLPAGGIIGLFVGSTLLSVFYTILKEWKAVPDEDSSVARHRAD